MKALSVQQPYAWAIVRGFKPVKNRSWWSSFTGRFLVHAGKRELKDDVESVLRKVAEQIRADIVTVRETYARERFLGGIVGAATMTDCVTRHPSPWFFGPYGFVLADPLAFDTPVPCRGQLGFFDAPLGIMDQVRAQAAFARSGS